MAHDMFAEGSVGMREIQNVFVEYKSKFEQSVWPAGGNPSRRDIMEFIGAIQYAMYDRCRKNAANNHNGKAQAEAAPADPQNQEEYERSRSRIATNLSRFEP